MFLWSEINLVPYGSKFSSNNSKNSDENFFKQKYKVGQTRPEANLPGGANLDIFYFKIREFIICGFVYYG